MDFGAFAKKYNVEAAVPLIFAVAPGLGDLSTKPTLFVMQAFGAPMTRSFLEGTLFVPASRNNSDLYSRISELLGPDVLYSAMVERGERSEDGVELAVKLQNGDETLVRAKRLLVAIQPNLEGLSPLGLDETEERVYKRWKYSNVYASIVTHPSLPNNTALTNTPAQAAPSNYLALPQDPFTCRFDYMGAPIFRALIVGNESLSVDGSKGVTKAALQKIIEAGTISNTTSSDQMKFVAFANHGAMHLRVTTEELKAGFISDLYALQGHKSTWYTGAGWSAQFTSVVWAFTDTVLPKLVKDLEASTKKV
jgi:hypothetical protein